MKIYKSVTAFILTFLCMVCGCSQTGTSSLNLTESTQQATETADVSETATETEQEEKTEASAAPAIQQDPVQYKTALFNISDIPAYNEKPYVSVNNNIPYFTEADYTTSSFENYSPLDSLGRCGAAFANIGTDIMPTEERGSIGSVKPTGWHTIKYENIDGKYLYNRCHLIGYQLSGENANEKNLITGTRYLNVTGMLPFENMVADYVQETNNHVLYRVTPIFDGNNLLASGVLMEALSMEDNGAGICYNVFCYNVQPGIIIDYETGESNAENGSAPYGSSATVTVPKQETAPDASTAAAYIANKNTKKFHYPSCHSVEQMKEKNKKYLNRTREDAINQGYSPCGNCNP